MPLNEQARRMLPIVEVELRKQVHRLAAPTTRPFHGMLAYHMGWTRSAESGGKGGKRIRPLLSLLVCASVGGKWHLAVPAAAALELVHNFSLVHDDIQDNSPTRRGRPTLWRKSGVPLAINSGDALFTIANQAALDLSKSFETSIVVRSLQILEQACLDLTKGQFLDLFHQARGRLSIKGYWSMIEGKTAALVAAATEIGAVLGGADNAISTRYARYGRLLGLAFQVQDDILGIWGDEMRTGKSAASDLIEGKLSLPVVYGLGKKGRFADGWRDAGYRVKHPGQLKNLLELEGGLKYATRHASRLTEEAISMLERLRPQGSAGAALEELTRQLLGRQA